MQETNEYLIFIETKQGEKSDYSIFCTSYDDAKNEAEKKAEKSGDNVLRVTIIEVI
jgi:hypothetical protein